MEGGGSHFFEERGLVVFPNLGSDLSWTFLAAEAKKEVLRATRCLPPYSSEATHSLASSAEWLGMKMEKSTGSARIRRTSLYLGGL